MITKNISPIITVLLGVTALLGISMLLPGCAVIPVEEPALISNPSIDTSAQDTQQCLDWIHYLDQQIEKRDAQYQRVDAQPWLRTDRFLQSFDDSVIIGDDLSENVLSVTSVSPSKRQRFLYQSMVEKGLEAFLDELFLIGNVNEHKVLRCMTLISKRWENKYASSLLTAIPIKDNYSWWKRALGLYPIIKPLALNRILAFQAETKELISDFENAQLISNNYKRYSPNFVPNAAWDKENISRQFKAAYHANPLSIPKLSSITLEILFHHYAPDLAIETKSVDDLIGTVRLSKEKTASIDTAQPTSYTFTSYTRFQGKNLLQLNYAYWFPSRPSNDVYGGFLDGIIWRVTLDENGAVLLFDSIHQCGCYHKYFIPETNQLRLTVKKWDRKTESPLILIAPNSEHPTTLFISATTHYILGVNRPTTPEFSPMSKRYSLEEYRNLHRLQNGDQKASLFSSNGLVIGTERKERFYFWPLGISSAGAMRQKGTHATAFVGRQHFDDPFIFESIFEGKFRNNHKITD